MDIRSLRYIGIIGVAGVVIAAVFLVVPQRKATSSAVQPAPRIVRGEALYVTNLADDRKLVGLASNVFVARVISQTGSEPLRGRIPATQFAVEIVENIKGNLQGQIQLSQVGAGYQNGVLHLMEDEKGLLDIGATYLFAATYDETEGLYQISGPPYDRQLISVDSLNGLQLQAVVDVSPRVRALKAAYPNEVLMKGAPHWNSYVSRHYDVQGNLIDDTVVLHQKYMAAHPSASSPQDSVSATPSPTDAGTAPTDAAVAPSATPVPSDVGTPASSDAPVASPADQPVQS